MRRRGDLEEDLTRVWFSLVMVFVTAIFVLLGWAFVMMILTIRDFAMWLVGQ